jgi:predicted HTH transcriptional regulator
MMVKELLQLLVDEIDPQLLKTVEIKDLKAGDVQHTNEVISGVEAVNYQKSRNLLANTLLGQGLVTFDDQPVEHARVKTLNRGVVCFKLKEAYLSHGADGPIHLLQVLTFVDLEAGKCKSKTFKDLPIPFRL